jgi:hypothetical protein
MRHQILQKLKVQIILATNLIELFGKEEASNHQILQKLKVQIILATNLIELFGKEEASNL